MSQLLIRAGASVNYPDRKGNTAIHLSVARGDIQTLEVLSTATDPKPDFDCMNFAGEG